MVADTRPGLWVVRAWQQSPSRLLPLAVLKPKQHAVRRLSSCDSPHWVSCLQQGPLS
jgi:hypothetical protein